MRVQKGKWERGGGGGADLQNAIQKAARHLTTHFFTENGSDKADDSNSFLGRATELAFVSGRRGSRSSSRPG